jgi:hypothetical protein
MLENDASNELDVSDHCITVATKDSLVQAKQQKSNGHDKTLRGSKRLSKRASPTSLGSFVEDCNNSFSALDLQNDISDLCTVDSRTPNMTGSKTRLTSDRPTRRPVKRTPSEEMKASFPVKFDRAF